MIDRDYRDVGLGSEMIRRLEMLAQLNGIETIIIEVFKINKRAIYLYSKLGYEQIGSLKNAIKQDDKYIDSLIMQKMINY